MGEDAQPIRSVTPAAGVRRRGRPGITLIETMAALLLVAIALPVVMRGVSLATAAGAAARRRGEAAALAQSKMAQLVATGDWELGAQSGEFGAEWSDYSWDLAVGDWSMTDVRRLDLSVSWASRGKTQSVTLTTLAYLPPEEPPVGTANPASSTDTSGSSTSGNTQGGRR